MGTLNNRCRTVIRTQKGTIILTTTQIRLLVSGFRGLSGSRLQVLRVWVLGWAIVLYRSVVLAASSYEKSKLGSKAVTE